MRRALLGLVLILVTAVGSAWLLDASIDKSDDEVFAPSSDGRAALSGVRIWSYQLHGLQPDRVASSLHVVDETLGGYQAEAGLRVLRELRASRTAAAVNLWQRE